MANLLILDTETWSLDTQTCEIVELAAIVLDGETLDTIEGGEFQSYIKPVKWDNYDKRAIEVNKITPELLQDKGRERKPTFEAFESFCKQFRIKGMKFGSEPIAAGKNIKAFDLPIIDRVCREEGMASKDGLNKFFNRRIILDLEDVLWFWFRGYKGEKPPSMKMDDLRPYFGLSSEGAHGALVDVKQEALLLKRFLQLPNKYKVDFKGALIGATL